MKLSILLPTHNRADVLPFAIESVLGQTFTDFELLIVGDGCTDGTADAVTRHAAHDARVRWYDLPKAAGFGYANRNVALKEARGELIGYMAHDDLALREHFGRLVGLMEEPAVELAHTSATWVAPDGAMVPTVFHLEDPAMREGLIGKVWNRLPSPCFMHRRSALAEAGMWDETLLSGGDMDLWGRILLHYGPGCVRGSPHATVLHFRAGWRTDDMVNPDNEPPWLRLHGEPGRLSRWLRVPIEAGQTEQEAASRWLRAHPEAGREIGEACTHALMTHAWELEKVASGHEKHVQLLRRDHETFAEAAAKAHGEAAVAQAAVAAAARAGTLRQVAQLEERRDDLTAQRDALKSERDRLKETVRSLPKEPPPKKRWWERAAKE